MVVCKDENAVKERFGIGNEGIGACFTRTGRNFFNDSGLEGVDQLLESFKVKSEMIADYTKAYGNYC